MFETIEPENKPENKSDDLNEDMNGGRQPAGPRPVFAAEPTPARRVAEGAMLVASAVIFGLSASYLPFLWLVAMFLWPVPLALLVRRFGPGFGLAGILLTMALLAIFIGPLSAFFMLLNMGGVGFWYGYAARRDLNPWITVVAGVFIAAVSMVLMLVFSTMLAGLQLDDLRQQMDQIVDFYISNMQSRGQLQQLLGGLSVEEYTELFKEYVASLLPASLVFLAMLEAGVCYALNGYVFRRLGYPVTKLPPFKDWRLHWTTLWGLIIALLAFIGYWKWQIDWCQLLYSNIMYVYQPLLILSGVTLCYWLADRLKMPWAYIFLLVMLVISFNTVSAMLLMVGLSDSIWDIRRTFAKPPVQKFQ